MQTCLDMIHNSSIIYIDFIISYEFLKIWMSLTAFDLDRGPYKNLPIEGSHRGLVPIRKGSTMKWRYDGEPFSSTIPVYYLYPLLNTRHEDLQTLLCVYLMPNAKTSLSFTHIVAASNSATWQAPNWSQGLRSLVRVDRLELAPIQQSFESWQYEPNIRFTWFIDYRNTFSDDDRWI